MLDRDFNEVDLRRMLQHAQAYRSDVVDGRWVITTHRGRIPWEVIVEPDTTSERLVVITAYAVWES
jgi:hypothetical protein